MVNDELRGMVLDYMEKGFLENIIDMFTHDETLFPLVVDMIRDERMRVRLGATALVEELAPKKQQPFVKLIPDIGALLKSPNPVVRGDGAHILGLIKHRDALPYLLAAREDADRNVREIVVDAIEEIKLL